MNAKIIQNNEGLKLDDLKKVIPSIFATRAAAHRSDRYVHISTARQVQPLLSAGWIITRAQQRSTRTNGRDPRYTRHALTMRPADLSKPMLNEVLPEVTLINSHDGQSKFSLYAGLQRLVCLNGLTVATGPNARLVVRHSGKLENLVEQAQAVLKVATDSTREVKAMMKTSLTPEQAIAFAKGAVEEIFERDDLEPEAFLERRREADEEATLWNTFNVVQENIVRGGIHLESRAGRRASTLRGITHVQRTVDVNTVLWTRALALAA